MQHEAAYHEQSDALAGRKPGHAQSTLDIDCAGALRCQPPGKLRREMEKYSGRSDAFFVCFAEAKPLLADIAFNGMDILRVTPQLAYLLLEAFDVAGAAHQHPGLVPLRSKSGQQMLPHKAAAAGDKAFHTHV
ncbi:hypothetical protein D3C75_863940 [compost metagenome]